MDKIIINGLKVFSLIGVYDWERESKTQLDVDITLGLDLGKAAVSDKVDDTIDYAELADMLVAVADESEYELLEALANTMVGAIFDRYSVQHVSIRITKPGILPNAQNVAIELNRVA